jgi:hypothetical protein
MSEPNSQPIIIPFTTNDFGRVMFTAQVLKQDFKSHGRVDFQYDSGSDITLLSVAALDDLDYERSFLETCPIVSVEDGRPVIVNTADGKTARTSDGELAHLRCIRNLTIKFGNRELVGCTIYFALDSDMSTLFGGNILKYFNREINYDAAQFILTPRTTQPVLSGNEKPIQVYSVAQSGGITTALVSLTDDEKKVLQLLDTLGSLTKNSDGNKTTFSTPIGDINKALDSLFENGLVSISDNVFTKK